MPEKREKAEKGGGGKPGPPAVHTRNLVRKQFTLDDATLEGLKVIQDHEPDVRGDSAAIRYAVRTAVERLEARKARKPRP